MALEFKGVPNKVALMNPKMTLNKDIKYVK